MSNKFANNVLISLFVVALASGCSSSDSNDPVTSSNVDLSFSDAAVDGATEVVITVDKITFRPAGDGDDIIVDQFNGDTEADLETEENLEAEAELTGDDETADAGSAETDTFTIDLLTVQGNDSRLVLDDIQLPVGEYSNMLLEVIDEDIDKSYVTDATGVKTLKVPSQILKLGAFTITPNSKQSMVVEFGLQQSMTYNPGPDRYILKPRGVRIVSVDEAANVSGTIDHGLLQAFEQCDPTDLGGTSGKLYIYEGHGLDATALADNYDPAVAADATNKVAPIASSSLDAEIYVLSYLEPGNYTLSVSCHAEVDDADGLDNIVVPNPANQLTEISLSEGNSLVCSIPLDESSCALAQ